MKKRIMLAISVLLVLGLTIAVFAFNTTNSSTKTTMNCCQKDKDSCPMKNRSADQQNASTCCDMPDCCCKGGGDSCPMKKQTETSSQSVDMQNVTVVTSAENCCQKGADCCKNGGACCKKKS